MPPIVSASAALPSARVAGRVSALLRGPRPPTSWGRSAPPPGPRRGKPQDDPRPPAPAPGPDRATDPPTTAPEPTAASGRRGRSERAAIFIDLENVSSRCVEDAMILASGDRVLTARAYACFGAGAGGGPRGGGRLRELGIVAVDVERASGKNSADIRLCIDAVNLINTMGLDRIYLATGDSDFRHLLDYAREVGVHTCLVQSSAEPTRSLAERADVCFPPRPRPANGRGGRAGPG